jgi:hypothetical protein
MLWKMFTYYKKKKIIQYFLKHQWSNTYTSFRTFERDDEERIPNTPDGNRTQAAQMVT